MFRLKFPLQVTLLTLNTLTLLAVVVSLAWFNFSQNSRDALDIANKLLAELNGKVLIEVQTGIQPVTALCANMPSLPGLGDKPQGFSHPVRSYLLKAFDVSPLIYSMYFGYKDGDFFQIIHIPEDEESRRKLLDAPPQAHFALRRIELNDQGQREERWQFLDEQESIVEERGPLPAKYDPRVRPWFMDARTSSRTIKTKPYIFTSTRSRGMTMAQRFYGEVPGVFGVDLTLKSISEFLRNQHVGKTGFAFLFSPQGYLLAHPGPQHKLTVHDAQGTPRLLRLDEMGDPVISALFTRFKDDHEMHGCGLNVQGRHYLTRVTALPPSSLSGSYLAVVAPADDFTATMVETRNTSLLFALALLLGTTPIIVIGSRQIAATLHELARQSHEIRHFRLDEPVIGGSFIREVNDLTKAVSTMKHALRSFGRYVPSTLVRLIVANKLDSEVGGKRHTLSLLFTDVADFTTISEQMEPEALMRQASHYFQTVGSTISDCGGTVDKYIGDAVMAFWNAPEEDPEHARSALIGALSAAFNSNVLNDLWVDQGKAPFFTRFGLHTGECIVGNVGSSDRVNYTAMGNAVNLAARLEGLNKYFGTQILVSQAIIDQLGSRKDEFLLRSAGKVIAKGASVPMAIHALVGSMPESWLPMPVTQQDIDLVQQWEEAYTLFMARHFDKAHDAFQVLLKQHPDDGLSRFFLERARDLAAHPPPDDWNGVETFTTK